MTARLMRDILKLHSGTHSGTGISWKKIVIFGDFRYNLVKVNDFSFVKNMAKKFIFFRFDQIGKKFSDLIFLI